MKEEDEILKMRKARNAKNAKKKSLPPERNDDGDSELRFLFSEQNEQAQIKKCHEVMGRAKQRGFLPKRIKKAKTAAQIQENDDAVWIEQMKLAKKAYDTNETDMPSMK